MAPFLNPDSSFTVNTFGNLTLLCSRTPPNGAEKANGLAKYKRVYTSRKAPKMTGGYYLVLGRDPEDAA